MTTEHLVIVFTEDSRQTELLEGILEEATIRHYSGISVRSYQRQPKENLKDLVRTQLDRFVKKGQAISLLLIVRDTDCRESNELETQIEKWLKPAKKRADNKSVRFPNLVVALPSPHIEKWYLVDLRFWRDKVKDTSNAPPLNECKRNFYKRKLEEMCKDLPRRGTEYGKDLGKYLYREALSGLDLPKDLAKFLDHLNQELGLLRRP